MKRLIVALLLLTWLPLQAQSVVNQNEIMVEYVTIELDSTATANLYVLFQPTKEGGRYAISETAPTKANTGERQTTLKRGLGTGDLAISIIPDTLTRQESDSLAVYYYPYVWDETKAAYYSATTDVKYLVFDTADTYVQTAIDYLDWTHGTMYTSAFSGRILPFSGIHIVFDQKAYDTSTSASTLYVGIWFVR
jgi:hypothetical protein